MSQTTVVSTPSRSARSSVTPGLLASTILLGAFLLFAVEPMIAKMILPWFGGSTEVWIVCLLFFQAALLGGYIYAHVLSTQLSALWQYRLHVALLIGSLFFLPVIPSEWWKPGDGEPMLRILGVLTATIGLPFLLLAASAPLVQAWLSYSGLEAAEDRNGIYRLYALSNFGSLLALILYPVLIEPWLATRMQAAMWSALYCVFAFFSAAAAWNHRHVKAQGLVMAAGAELRASTGARALWFLLALAPSALLLATTNYMLRNIAAIPLFWVVPLAIYLLSFIIAFDSPRWYYRPLWYALFAGFAGAMIYYAVGLFFIGNYFLPLAFYSSGLFICCMMCNGELAARKPAPNQITGYYLIIAAGGAAGGLVIAVLAPLMFSSDYDFAFLLPLVALLAILVAWSGFPKRFPAWLRWYVLAVTLAGWAFVTGHMVLAVREDISNNVLSARNFYGPLRVTRTPANRLTGEMVRLVNGNIAHGQEFTAAQKRCEPISYYGPQSGVGIAIREMMQSGPLNIGVIGLGAGTIAGYGRNIDRFRFYEINPLVRAVATSAFHYLACPGDHSIAGGDARLSLEREPSQQFDILVVDAFTSDSIPLHLLTREAFSLYWRHLKADGVLAVHVSNQYIDLEPIVAAGAGENGKTPAAIANRGDPAKAMDASDWVLVTSRPNFFAAPELKSAKLIKTSAEMAWTDDYSNLWRALK